MNAREELAEQMAERVIALLDTFDPAQRAAATWAFDDAERELWFYTPTDHGGLPLSMMTATQHRLTHQLVATGLSEAGYVTASAIIGLENVLDRLEGWSVHYGRERARDPLLYWIAVFGTPGSDAWGWRFGGHHISLNYTILGGEVASTTPLFFGADPASAPLLGPHPHRPLGGAEDLGRELVRSFSEEQMAVALVSQVPPTDIIGGNRSRLADGDPMLPLTEVWRGRFEAELDSFLSDAQASAESALGLTAEHLDSLRLTSVPKGVSAAALGSDQQEMLRAVLDVYLDRLPPELADEEKAKFAGDRLGELSFLWAGSTEPQNAHYYRIQGAELLVEYDNTPRGGNHVHAVWRDLRRDFGRLVAPDPLAQHYADATRHDHNH